MTKTLKVCTIEIREGIMNKSRKGFLTTASIITIVASSFAMLFGFAFFFLGSMVSEDIMKESYLQDEECVYYENADGSYYFIELDEDGEETITTQSDIKFLANIVSGIINFAGLILLGFGVAKLVLAIRVLLLNNKNKYSKGCTIALLVLSVLNTNILEAVFLIVALTSVDKQQTNNSSIEPENKPEIETMVE